MNEDDAEDEEEEEDDEEAANEEDSKNEVAELWRQLRSQSSFKRRQERRPGGSCRRAADRWMGHEPATANDDGCGA